MRRYRTYLATSVAALGIFVAACAGQPAVTTSPQAVPSSAAAVAASSTNTADASAASMPGTPTAAPTSAASTGASVASSTTPVSSANASPTAASASSSSTSATLASASETRYDVASGSKASYQVREQLVRLNAPSDAVGTTSAVSGDIVIGADGKVDSTQSKLVVDLTSLQSDSSMRDHFIQGNTLETDQYPTATFVPTAITGLTGSLASAGQHNFQLVGNMTIHGVTKPVTFGVTAQASGNTVTGQATTHLTFEDFGMTPPKAGAVLSVNDSIALAVTLNLSKAA